jgi:hypothetical protein
LDLDLAPQLRFDPFPSVGGDQDTADIEVVILQVGRVLSSMGRGMDGEEAVISSLFNGAVC